MTTRYRVAGHINGRALTPHIIRAETMDAAKDRFVAAHPGATVIYADRLPTADPMPSVPVRVTATEAARIRATGTMNHGGAGE